MFKPSFLYAHRFAFPTLHSHQSLLSGLRKLEICALLAVALLGSAGPALADKPWTAGPSTLLRLQTGDFSAGSLPPGGMLQVELVTPLSGIRTQEIWVTADGTARYSVTPDDAGDHEIRIVDSAGTVLTSTQFISN